MSDIAIRVEGLSKRYRIGKSQDRTDGNYSLLKRAAAPFRYLANSLREPDPEEIIWALRDVSFEVKRGEVVGIIGSNGAGKSTLLKILSRITEPTSGRAVVRGRVGSLLEVGTGFHPELTGRENIYLNGAILGMHRSEINSKYDDIVAFAEIEKFLDTPVKHYSSGMYVRLAFAVAAHLDPEILLVDEVLAVGDAAFQKKCLSKMGEVAKEGRTVLFVSHNLIALQNLCQRAIRLDIGKLVEDGNSSEVVANYHSLQSMDLTEQIWEDLESAPGNEVVRLHHVSIKPENECQDRFFPREIPLLIQIEFWNLKPGVELHITLHVYVEQQIVAFTSSSANDPTWQNRSLSKGLYRNICRIPANLLNIGNHSIRVLVIQDRSRVIYTLDGALSFDIVEVGKRQGAWFGKEPGVVRPILEWSTHYLG